MPVCIRNRLFYLTLFLHLGILSAIQAQQNEYTSPAGTKYLLYLPPGYTPSADSPLLVYLHGGASIGDDITELFRNHITPPRLINNGNWPASRPLVVLSPLLPRDESVSNPNDQKWPMDLLNEVIEDVINNYSLDENRIYFSGISLGGTACWDYTVAYPAQVAAIVPFSGVSDTTEACNFIDTPVWAFHGSVDGLVPTKLSTDMIDAINDCSPAGQYKPHLTLLYSKKHEGWNEVYDGTSGYGIYEWMLMFSKTDLSNKKPYVNAGFDKNIFLRNKEFNVFYECFDWNNSISSINWTQLSGPGLTLTYDQQGSFLKLEDLTTGIFSFKLEATDDLGLSNSDTITITILDPSTSGIPVIEEILLHDGETATPIGTLQEDQIINLSILGIERINLEAIANSTTVSVRFHINGSHYTLRTGNSGPYFLRDPSKTNHWQIRTGEFYFCATAFEENGTRGDPGITQCRKVRVYNQPIRTFYPKPSSDLTQLTSWSDVPDGSGTPPETFTDVFQEFMITEDATIDNSWDISGIGSFARVQAGKNLKINGIFTGTLYADEMAVIEIYNASQVSFDSLNISSTVKIFTEDYILPKAEYGNLHLLGSNTTKFLSKDTTVVNGDLLIETNVTLNGSPDDLSTISLKGDMSDDGTSSLTSYNLNLASGSNQNIQTSKAILSYPELSLSDNTSVELTSSHINRTEVNLGYINGGGLKIGQNALFRMGSNSISINNSGSINAGNTSGEIGIINSDLTINSSSDLNSYLNIHPNNNDIITMDINMTGTGQLFINTPMNIHENLSLNNGTMNSLGNLHFQSEPSSTAYIETISGNGHINGGINMERSIENAGRIWKYMSSPLSGSTVSDWQQFIPITGSFPESTPGFSANPSLYYYDEPQGGWIPFPENSAQEEFILGKGYAIFLRADQVNSPLDIVGDVHIGDFQFNLTPDPDIGVADNGWNLVGNPYPSPILWSQIGWTSSGVNNTIYIRDNTVSGGRFLTWQNDGTGDPEFSGKIAIGQSFWVRTTTESPEMIISENAKIPEAEVNLLGSAQNTNDLPKGVITLHGNGLLDRTYLKFSKEYSKNFDSNLDAIKKKNGYFNLFTLSADSIELAINCTHNSCTQEIPLIPEDVEPGEYSFEFIMENFDPATKIYFEDRITGERLPIKDSNFYSFKVSAEEIKKLRTRFSINISNKVNHNYKISTLPVCDNAKYAWIILNRSDINFTYEFFFKDSLIATVDNRNEHIIRIPIPVEILNIGLNEVQIKSIYKFCDYTEIDTVDIHIFEAPRAYDLDLFYCDKEKIKIHLKDIDVAITANWYTYVDGEYQLIKSSRNLNLFDPDIKSIYYELVDKNGCFSSEKGKISININSVPEPEIYQRRDTLISNYLSGNQWFRNNTLIPNATDNYLIPEDPGKYHVVVDSLGCRKESGFVMINPGELRRKKSGFLIQPNPVEGDYLNIYSSSSAGVLYYTILNHHGSIMDSGYMKFKNQEINIPLKKNIKTGIYVIMIRNKENIHSARFMVR